MKSLKIINVLLISVFFLSACSYQKLIVDDSILIDQISLKNQIKINNTLINVESVVTIKDRERGLSGRQNLCSDCGMLFFQGEAGLHSFWMKDMSFPIDIIYISDDQVVEIFRNVPVKTNDQRTVISPTQKADKVLELNAGFCDEYDIREGDMLEVISE